ncbi:MAG: hypothetical protein LN413_05875 [Candidatus Thermoplasmatota archaeon]|nr:hypothetical protein [Candidatus Thermoplasmatota archaeon]
MAVLENGHCKVLLTVDDVPRRWYNIVADLPEPLPPPVDPATKEPIGPEALTPLFPGELIQQEVSLIAKSTSQARSGRPTFVWDAPLPSTARSGWRWPDLRSASVSLGVFSAATFHRGWTPPST